MSETNVPGRQLLMAASLDRLENALKDRELGWCTENDSLYYKDGNAVKLVSKMVTLDSGAAYYDIAAVVAAGAIPVIKTDEQGAVFMYPVYLPTEGTYAFASPIMRNNADNGYYWAEVNSSDVWTGGFAIIGAGDSSCGWFLSPAYTTTGGENLRYTRFKIAPGQPIVGTGIAFEPIPDVLDGGDPVGTVYLNPGIYVLHAELTLQWEYAPVNRICVVGGFPVDFTYNHTQVVPMFRLMKVTSRSAVALDFLADDLPADLATHVSKLDIFAISAGDLDIAGLESVTHDSTLEGDGTASNPLKLAGAAVKIFSDTASYDDIKAFIVAGGYPLISHGSVIYKFDSMPPGTNPPMWFSTVQSATSYGFHQGILNRPANGQGASWTWSQRDLLYEVLGINSTALTEAATINVPNGKISSLTLTRSAVTFNVDCYPGGSGYARSGTVPFFCIEITAQASCAITCTWTRTYQHPETLCTEFGTTLYTEAGKKYQLKCFGMLWSLEEVVETALSVADQRLASAGRLVNNGVLTDAASITVPNNAVSQLTTSQSSLTLNVNLKSGEAANFAVEVTAIANVALTLTSTSGGSVSTLRASVAGGNSLESGKSYQVTCVGTCWTLAEFEMTAPHNAVEIGGRQYPYVRIGDQLWITENLDYQWSGLSVGQSGSSTSEARGNYYNDDSSTYGASGNKYGLLYNWPAVKYLEDHPELLPSGWHVPSSAELDILATAVGGREVAGTKLKSAIGWPSGAGTDVYGFAVYPAGHLMAGSFGGVGSNVSYWTASEFSSANAYCRSFNDNAAMIVGNDDKSYGFPIRLVKDVT